MNPLTSSPTARLEWPLRVLIAESVDTTRKVLEDLLRDLGAGQIQSVSNGAKAWRLLQTQQFDLIVADADMPVANGIQLLRAVRAHEQLQSTPFLLTTAHSDRALIESAIHRQVSAILLKPYSRQQLLAHVKACLQPTSPSAPDSAAHSTQEQLSLLLVDDSPDNLDLMSQLLKGECQLRLAVNAEKALQVCASDAPPDLILLDVMMPGTDGFELAALLRKQPATADIPIVFVTSLQGHGDQVRGLSLGAVDFVTKPVDPDLLKLKVRNLLRMLRHQHALQQQVDSALAQAQRYQGEALGLQERLRAPLKAAKSSVQWLASNGDLAREAVDHLNTLGQALGAMNDVVNPETDHAGEPPAGSGPEAFRPA